HLFEQRRWNLRRRCGDDDAVEWRCLRPSVIAVALTDMDSVVTKGGQPDCRLLGQARYNLDGIDLMPQFGPHRGLLAGAGSNFEGGSGWPEPQQVGHQGDNVWLRDGLTVTDWQRPIGIGQIALGGGHEGMARYATHRVEHGRIKRCRCRAATALT